MNWRDYEKEIHQQFQEMYPDAEITHNTTLPGRYSKIDRQIDVLIEDYVAGDRIRIMVDGKYFSENIDVKEVECFIGMMQDVSVDKGLLITQKGYSKAAIMRAHNDPSRIELDILNFEELKQFQGFGALPYSGKHGVVMPSPFGWVIDATRRDGFLATLYQRGLTLEEAGKNKEWMYV
ncbi:MAG: restriction endonuclease, partial [Ekhidna sp.]